MNANTKPHVFRSHRGDRLEFVFAVVDMYIEKSIRFRLKLLFPLYNMR